MDFNGIFPTILAGAIGGAVINTVAYTVGAVISGDKITVEGLASSAASGAVVGGMLGAGITNPAILGAASSLVSGAMNGQSGKELLHTTKVGALQGGVMGLAFSTLGPAATIATGAVMKGGQNLIEQVFDDNPGVDWISVGRHTLGGAAETGTAMLGYSKMGSYLSGKQKSIVGQKTEAAYNKMVKGVKQTAYNAQRNIQQAVRNMGEMLSPRNQLSTPEGFTFDAFGYENGAKYSKASSGGGGSREEILPSEKTHASARKTLLKELDSTGAFKNGSNKSMGRLKQSYGYGKQIGRQSFDGKVRWRLDYDETLGVHYNIENFSNGKGINANKKVIPIEITYEEYRSIIDSWN